LALDAREQRRMAMHQLPGAVDAGRHDPGRGVFLEALAERAALTPVEGKHRAVLRETSKRAVGHRPRDSDSRGFARHRHEEGAEIASACRRA